MGIFFFVLKGDFIYESNLKHYKLLKCKYPTPMYPSQYLIMKLECHTAAIRIHIIQYCFPLLHKSFFKFFTYNPTYSLSALICNHKITTLYIWLWLSGIINTAITNFWLFKWLPQEEVPGVVYIAKLFSKKPDLGNLSHTKCLNMFLWPMAFHGKVFVNNLCA